MQRETKILVLEIGVLLFGIIGMICNLWLQHKDDEAPELSPFSVRQAVSGAISAVALTYIDDHDVGGVRRSCKRLVLFMFGWNLLIQKIDPEIDWSFSLGSAFGSLAYRFWFGIVRPIPEPRLNYSGFLRRRR
ncbi:MAG: hypothetical protein IH933_09620 [Euryarchaeota archaeon]|nr:hypothetical protein [Euryarchaeota archaeon]